MAVAAMRKIETGALVSLPAARSPGCSTRVVRNGCTVPFASPGGRASSLVGPGLAPRGPGPVPFWAGGARAGAMATDVAALTAAGLCTAVKGVRGQGASGPVMPAVPASSGRRRLLPASLSAGDLAARAQTERDRLCRAGRQRVLAILGTPDAAGISQPHIHGMVEDPPLRRAARDDHLEQVAAAGSGELHPAVLDRPQVDGDRVRMGGGGRSGGGRGRSRGAPRAVVAG